MVLADSGLNLASTVNSSLTEYPRYFASYMRFGKGKRIIELCLERKARKHGFAGIVASKLFRETIGIYINDELLEEYCIGRGYITAQEDGTHPIIILDTDTFNGIKRGENADRFLLLHETGHYSCGHLAESSALDDEFSYRKE